MGVIIMHFIIEHIYDACDILELFKGGGCEIYKATYMRLFRLRTQTTISWPAALSIFRISERSFTDKSS